ncbi:beta-aspartyl-peptidase [Thalassotalea aquiviva]|uniref:beta-aspartyl-peptidase n=1 Tax=Thalassotalea aquiviva TaxID=3242415 RepID=UPI00352A7F7B
MMKLFKNAIVFAPQYLGKQDVLVASNKIIAIDHNIELEASHSLTVIDAKEQYLIPGLVDSLVHISGGGGEGGFATRTPEMSPQDAVYGGVTTLIGALGTDSVTRSLEDLVAKAKALKEFGLSAYCYSGSYHYPVKTITASLEKDILMIDEIIGVGEVAISDHRSSQMSVDDLARLTSQARVGGMLAGKSGIVSIHVGDEPTELALLEQVCQSSGIPLSQFYPTHINRSQSLLNTGIEFAKKGGFIDFTTSTTEQILAAGEVAAPLALKMALDAGVHINHISMSSDGNGSLPVFDQESHLIDLQVANVRSLHQAMVTAHQDYQVDLAMAIGSVTKSPANILGLAHKGRIEVGADADLLLLERESLAIDSVFALGQPMMQAKTLTRKPYFS